MITNINTYLYLAAIQSHICIHITLLCFDFNRLSFDKLTPFQINR